MAVGKPIAVTSCSPKAGLRPEKHDEGEPSDALRQAGLAMEASSETQPVTPPPHRRTSKQLNHFRRFRDAAHKVFLGNKIVSQWRTQPVKDPTSEKPREVLAAGTLKGRRWHRSSLRVNCARTEAPARRVCFSADGSDEVFEAFTPYSSKYGEHPADFDFDKNGRMKLVEPEQVAVAGLPGVKVGDALECIAEDNVPYYTRPQMAAADKSRRGVLLGREILVKQVCGEWVQDSLGWVPLYLPNKKPAFEMVSPKEKPRAVAKPRVPVMCVSRVLSDP